MAYVAVMNQGTFHAMGGAARFGAGDVSFPAARVQDGKPNDNGIVTRSNTAEYRAAARVLNMARAYAKRNHLHVEMRELAAMGPAAVYRVLMNDGITAAYVGDTVFFARLDRPAMDSLEDTRDIAVANAESASYVREYTAHMRLELAASAPVLELEAA